jgi:hypothetical protein
MLPYSAAAYLLGNCEANRAGSRPVWYGLVGVTIDSAQSRKAKDK